MDGCIGYVYITHDVLWIKKKDLYARPFYFSFIQMALNLHLRVCEYRTARTPPPLLFFFWEADVVTKCSVKLMSGW